MTRTTKTDVTFSRPFSLTGIDRIQPAGTYAVETDEEPIQELSFSAHRRVATRITVADPGRPGCIETVDIEPAELAAALARDGLMDGQTQSTDGNQRSGADHER